MRRWNQCLRHNNCRELHVQMKLMLSICFNCLIVLECLVLRSNQLALLSVSACFTAKCPIRDLLVFAASRLGYMIDDQNGHPQYNAFVIKLLPLVKMTS